MSRENPLGNWNPQELIKPLLRMNRAEFDQRFGSTIFLLIKLQGHPPTLLEDLIFTWNSGSLAPERRGDDLGFFTQTASGKAGIFNKSIDPRSNKGRILPVELFDQPCFLAPVKKRQAADNILDTVTVGRTRNHDIVLRHASVSKYHASIQFESPESLLVKDAGSKNKTWIKGEPITRQTQVVSGETLRFGTVEAVVCDADTLWSSVTSVAAI
jgi:pSer/pThr/pTyr-binding forkhead associated (FHA) protein